MIPPATGISVVIPTYNRLPLLQETLASVYSQSVPADEVIVVDDGSTDGTREWLESEAAAGRLRPLFQPNLGPSAARNAGARAALRGWLVFLDSDDVWLP